MAHFVLNQAMVRRPLNSLDKWRACQTGNGGLTLLSMRWLNSASSILTQAALKELRGSTGLGRWQFPHCFAAIGLKRLSQARKESIVQLCPENTDLPQPD